MISKIEIERILAWRSDDFGHDCQSLLVAESEALQRIGESHLELYADVERLNSQLSLSNKVATDNHERGYEWQVKAESLELMAESYRAKLLDFKLDTCCLACEQNRKLIKEMLK